MRRVPSAEAHPYADKSRGLRIQKVLAEAGVDSRRHCEQLVEEGRVAVNGLVLPSLPAWVDPLRDEITVDGHLIKVARRHRPRIKGEGSQRRRERLERQMADGDEAADPSIAADDGGAAEKAGPVGSAARSNAPEIAPPGGHVYLMLNKPRNVVCTSGRDPSGRRRALDLVDYPRQVRLFTVGRLDADSSGLLLLTNDGELANLLTHPRYGVHKSYEVVIGGALQAEDVERLQEGIYLADRRVRVRGAVRTKSVRLRLLRRDRDRTHLIMELQEGRNRQIRRMMARLGHPVKRLRRISLGPLRLKGLAIGHWRPLTTSELRELRKAAERGGREAEAGTAGGSLSRTRRSRADAAKA